MCMRKVLARPWVGVHVCHLLFSIVSDIDSHILLFDHSRPQRPRSVWSAPRIANSVKVQHRKFTIHELRVTLGMLRVKSDKSDRINTKQILCACSETWTLPEVAIIGGSRPRPNKHFVIEKMANLNNGVNLRPLNHLLQYVYFLICTSHENTSVWCCCYSSRIW